MDLCECVSGSNIKTVIFATDSSPHDHRQTHSCLQSSGKRQCVSAVDHFDIPLQQRLLWAPFIQAEGWL